MAVNIHIRISALASPTRHMVCLRLKKKRRYSMDIDPDPDSQKLNDLPSPESQEALVATLAGQVYEAAPVTDRRRLLEYLLPSMGVLALVAIADGIFAKIRFRSDWSQVHVRLEDASQVRGGDVVALVERLQQTSVDAVDGLAKIVSTSPVMASSAAAALLVALVVQRARARQAAELNSGIATGIDDR
jgi:hypothetical protein